MFAFDEFIIQIYSCKKEILSKDEEQKKLQEDNATLEKQVCNYFKFTNESKYKTQWLIF